MSVALDSARIPRHVAVIMDGNGRWAGARGLPRIAGHKAGVDSVRAIVRAAGELGIEALTLYSFSTENWLRPAEEVGELMKLLSWALNKETLDLDKNNVRLSAIGRLDALPKSVQTELTKAIERLKNNTGLHLVLALNYGGRQEISDAVNKALAAGEKIDEETIGRNLYTSDLPELDLMIRTSGEMRISNFLLWQAAYAELHVTPVLWPDFRKEHLVVALEDFQSRDRRFGGLSSKR
ncbi:MAG: isoprenyl transferase [Elusimicrobia bacterium]|nr:isoprenyl transferase [Elusimicrobiota bacterium]MDE2509933.1 isoprenyl transferase [Elusimicrobiota bacterium]